MTRREMTIGRMAAVIATLTGVLLMLMGSGHISAVLSAADEAGRDLDYRLLSIMSTGGFLFYSGLFNVVMARWMWLSREWAFGVCIFTTSALLFFLILLLRVKLAQTAPSENVGTELFYACAAAATTIGILAVSWFLLRRRA